MELKVVKIDKPDDVNLILGQAHFIKTVENLHEALAASAPGVKFGLAFCESSGLCLRMKIDPAPFGDRRWPNCTRRA